MKLIEEKMRKLDPKQTKVIKKKERGRWGGKEGRKKRKKRKN